MTYFDSTEDELLESERGRFGGALVRGATKSSECGVGGSSIPMDSGSGTAMVNNKYKEGMSTDSDCR